MTHNARPAGEPELDAIIVGAGLAGLYACYLLQQAGRSCVILEAEDHAGGRVLSRAERGSYLGLTLDEGANLINSTDRIAIKLMNRFDIRYVRRLLPGEDGMHYLVGDRELGEAEFGELVFVDSGSALAVITGDQQDWSKDDDRATNPRYFDESIAAYLGRLHAGPLLTRFMRSFFWSEYGRSLEELNLHVFFEYVAIDPAQRSLKLIPHVDEAYTVPGGTAQIAQALEAESGSSLLKSHRVDSIVDGGNWVDVSAELPDGRYESYRGRHVFFAAPLHSLGRMRVQVEGVSQYALQEAALASYARGSKLHLKFRPEVHHLYTYSGILLTENGAQIWTSGTGQSGGLLTVLTGPLPSGEVAAARYGAEIIAALEQVSPGIGKLLVGIERSDAAASYSGSFKPGEDSSYLIHAGGARWTTIGEASDPELQGYLEGALRSAETGVEQLLLKQRAHKRHA